MKRGLYIIFCSIFLILTVFTLVKGTSKEKKSYEAEKILVADNINYSTKIKNANTEKTEEIKNEKQEKKVEKKSNKNKTIKKKVNKNTTIKKSTNKSTTKKTNNTNKTNNTIKYGTFGRLYVSNYNVALYDYNVNTSTKKTLQTIVNDKDSAAYYTTKNKLVIADHNYQGFNILVNLKVGTTSYIKFKDGNTIKYKLTKKSVGVNTGPDLIDTKGNSFFSMKSDIIMYTCYKDGIMATLWTLA